MLFIISYSEIGLKGKNRPLFEKQLIRNISAMIPSTLTFKAAVSNMRVLLEFKQGLAEKEIEKVADILSSTFGVAWFAQARKAGSYEELAQALIESLSQNHKFLSAGSFKINTIRSDKSYPKTSVELNYELGSLVSSRFSKPVSLKSPEFTAEVIVNNKGFLYFSERHQGPGGLPVGIEGRVLSLLSGGIDSPVAAFLIMKRGCRLDFIHFYASAYSQAKESKIIRMAERLSKFQSHCRLYMAPYKHFYKASLGLEKEHGRLEVLLFKRFLLETASRLAENKGYPGLVTGDSLGQVSSQTLDNLKSQSHGINTLILRPLVGYDKHEIIELAKKIRTYELSIEKYKDCCSIFAKSPATKSKPESIGQLAEQISLNRIVEATLKDVKVIEFPQNI